MSMLRTALALAAKGIHVFPLMVRSKAPATATGFLGATADPDRIRDWWRCEPNFNIGIRTGTVSRLFAVDVDNEDAEASLRALERQYGGLPATTEVITPRGRHVYFHMPDAHVPCSTGKIAQGIDVKATGGYTLAPPSIHPTGRAYAWSVDSTNLALAPAWLLKIIVEPKANGHTPAPVSHWRAIVANGVSEGTRNSTATKLAGYLLRRFVDPLVALELMQLWNTARCTPPLAPEDVETIVASISAKELKRRNGHA